MIASLYTPFQHWSNGGTVWLLGDTHFDDTDSKTMSPEWLTPQEHIRLINSKVQKGDTFVLLGDVGNPSWVAEIKARYKVLIKGNHDKGDKNYKPYFDEIYGGPLFISDKILLSHEPIVLPYIFNIHGHDHRGTDLEGHHHLNLASNICGYTPANLKEIIEQGIGVEGIHRYTINFRI